MSKTEKPVKKLRILYNTNAPWATSGYSQQTAEWLPLVRDEGYPLACIDFYGLEGGKVFLDGVIHYPKINHVYGSDALVLHGRDFEADVTFTMQDIWVLHPDDLVQTRRFIPIVPIDHDPVPKVILDRLKFAYRIVTYSKFGQKQLQEHGLMSTFIPLTVDTEIFNPMDKKQRKLESKLPEDSYVVGMVGANKDNPPRKSFQEAMDAFKLFLIKEPKAIMYIHTNPDFSGGFPIKQYADFIGITDKLYFPDVYQMNFNTSKEKMNLIYNTFDVLLLPSVSEGFGIPCIESQACFVAGTKYSTDTLEEWMQKSYSGELITIETDKGSIECTPDHPFYTDKGWIRAGSLNNEYRLLYNSRYEEEGIYRGDIEKYSRIMDDPHNSRSSKNNKSNSGISSMDNLSGKNNQISPIQI